MFELKIGRRTYTITAEDIFLDNHHCVQLTSQSSEDIVAMHRPHPVLSKAAVKVINKYIRKQHEHRYSTNVEVFSLVL